MGSEYRSIYSAQVPAEESLGDIVVNADFTSATWNTIATHEILTITGLVRIRIIVECTGSVTGATGTLQLGNEGATTSLIGNTLATDLAINELWFNTAPTTSIGAAALFDRIVNEVDIGYEILTAALTGGNLRFHCWWRPLEAGALVVSGTGSAL